MSNPYINIYKNNPTAGLTDGTAVSTGGDNTSPIEFVLDASQNQSVKIPLGIRTETDYIGMSVAIADLNDTNDHLKLSLTENGEFADSIAIGSVSALNTIFWAQASSASVENPQTDRSASLQVTGIISAV